MAARTGFYEKERIYAPADILVDCRWPPELVSMRRRGSPLLLTF